MTLTAAINILNRLESNLDGSPTGAMRDLLDFADHNLADVKQAMVEADNTIYEQQRIIDELTRQLNAEYPDELRVMVYEHNQVIEERVPA